MDVFEGAYRDKRRAASVGRLHDSMVAQSSVVVRRLGGRRAGEMSGHRVLSSPMVPPQQTIDCLARRTAAAAVGRVLAAASQIIVVGDRESDIYQVFDGRPDGVDLVVRAAQDRKLADGGMLFAASAGLPRLGTQTVHVAPRRVGQGGRMAQVAVSAGTVTLCAPHNGQRQPGTRKTLTLTLIEGVEAAAPPGETALHWRLLTTLAADTLAAAQDIVDCYRLRWRIEQSFRMRKSDGMQIEDSQTTDTHRLFNLAALALGAAVRVIQLVDARDGSNRPASDVATAPEITAAMALAPTLEGKTERQKNHHPPGTLAWLAWIVARLGGWNCYYRPPGPKTMRQGWDRFAAGT